MAPPTSSHKGEIVVSDRLLGERWAELPMDVFCAPELTSGAKLAYSMLLALAWEGDGYPGHEAASDRFGRSVASVKRDLAKLQEFGLVEAFRESYGSTNSYHIFRPDDPGCKLKLERRRLNMSQKPAHTEPEGRSACAENGVKAVDSVLELESEGDSALVACAERLLAMAPEEELSSVVAHLKYFALDEIGEAIATTEAVAEQKELRKPIAYCYAILGNAKKVREHREAEAAPAQKKSARQWLRERAELMLGMARSLLEDWPADQVKAILLESYGHDPQTVGQADLAIRQALAPAEEPTS